MLAFKIRGEYGYASETTIAILLIKKGKFSKLFVHRGIYLILKIRILKINTLECLSVMGLVSIGHRGGV